ncbi:nucleotide-binding protein [Citrobacter freundii]|uniref:TIR domain-containing protein n=1 Tax=Enterobacter roggenkampii TaxID=1812935 RepID=UPI0015EABB11|nr:MULTISPECIES: TIR domain-containing protein [Enterobacteriaceae]MBA8033820.1 nucleotide-binding protein [Citrobacter freundii]MBA8033833.1 nucleotide-binding protein [Citrobacter freundii]QLU96973.1 nucleotide-binding protein [Enterobacter roggenkampii]QLU96985.1 nucleotide-binding protein [Enterobacter roggenkampii]
MKDNISNKFSELDSESTQILSQVTISDLGTEYIDNSKFIQWKIKAENLLHNVFGSDSSIFKNFTEEKNKKSFGNQFKLESLNAVILAAKYQYENSTLNKANSGDRVFIGHGRSHMWRELKDYINDNLKLPWDEFNRTPVAGLPTIARLSEMLNNAGIAFLVMTAEDEQQNGSVNARMNVVHEIGLFQGKLGFEKAIVLLEEGCSEFSNINGLGQIRFPKDNISAVFHLIREVLERENMLR